MPSGPELVPARFDEPDVYALALAQQEEMRGIYAGEADSGPSRDAQMFEESNGGAFLAVRVDGRSVGCGGVCRFDVTRGELKCMYVEPAARGLGLGRRLLDALEAEARRLGYAAIVLETGDRQPEALGLYASAGYERIPCYEPYASRELSLCFEKLL